MITGIVQDALTLTLATRIRSLEGELKVVPEDEDALLVEEELKATRRYLTRYLDMKCELKYGVLPS